MSLVDPKTPKEKLIRRLSLFLVKEGKVDGLHSCPLAMQIIHGLRKKNMTESAQYFKDKVTQSEEWWLKQYPRSRRAKLIREERKYRGNLDDF
jgi:hypothetical protein